MLLVKVDSTLSSHISNYVTVCEVFSDNAGSWLLLLGDLVTVALSVTCEMTSIIIVRSSSTANLYLGIS